MKLNLGCGFRKYPNFVNVDNAPECKPDVLWDLEQTPWPWEDNSVDEIRLEHTLEHLGETTRSYLNIWREIYRVCVHGGEITISVPHWRHDYFYNDPTHVRPITPMGLLLFDQKLNVEHIQAGDRSSKLGLNIGIDIELPDDHVVYGYDPDEPHGQSIVEVTMRARVIKPPRGSSLLGSHD